MIDRTTAQAYRSACDYYESQCGDDEWDNDPDDDTWPNCDEEYDDVY